MDSDLTLQQEIDYLRKRIQQLKTQSELKMVSNDSLLRQLRSSEEVFTAYFNISPKKASRVSQKSYEEKMAKGLQKGKLEDLMEVYSYQRNLIANLEKDVFQKNSGKTRVDGVLKSMGQTLTKIETKRADIGKLEKKEQEMRGQMVDEELAVRRKMDQMTFGRGDEGSKTMSKVRKSTAKLPPMKDV